MPAPAPRTPTPPPPGGPPPAPPPRATSTPPIRTGGAPAIRTGAAATEAPRVVLNAVEGFGKTTIGAYAPKPVILMAAGETGYEDLLSRNLVPEVPRALCEDWKGTLALLDMLSAEAGEYQTVVLDALGGFERLCHQAVCDRDFRGDWGEKGFTAYQRGPTIAVADWLHLLQRLDALHSAGLTIVCLSHAQVVGFRNPLGADFDQYGADLHKETWKVTHRWASAVLFGNFETVVHEESKRKAIGIGGFERVIYTQNSDAWKAKNRYGMPAEIRLPDDHTAAWSTLSAALHGGQS